MHCYCITTIKSKNYLSSQKFFYQFLNSRSFRSSLTRRFA